MPGGWARRENLPKGPNGRHLCRWCNLEVPKGRITFCSAWCVEEWRLRSDPGYLRERVLVRDRGICAGCGIDCLHAELQLKRLRGASRLKAFLDWGLRPGSRKSLWDAELRKRRRNVGVGQTSEVGQTPSSAADPQVRQANAAAASDSA
jgi:5-methylcytosine-specific restriction enzyme A